MQLMANDLMLKEVHKNLNSLLVSKMEALPHDLNKTRFLQNCMTVLQDTKGIEKCSAISVARTMLKGGLLGLDFMSKECYAIPYGNSLQFQTDYKGEIKLAKKYSLNPIKDIYAKLVRVGDEFIEEIKDGQQVVSFKPLTFNDDEIIGAFAVCYYQDGSMIYETMSKKDIEKTRKDYSKMPNGTSWTKSSGEMYKKTVLRRLCKNISLDFDSIEQKKAYDDGADAEIKEEKVKPKNILSENEVDNVEYSIVEDNAIDLGDDTPDFLKDDADNG